MTTRKPAETPAPVTASTDPRPSRRWLATKPEPEREKKEEAPKPDDAQQPALRGTGVFQSLQGVAGLFIGVQTEACSPSVQLASLGDGPAAGITARAPRAAHGLGLGGGDRRVRLRHVPHRAERPRTGDLRGPAAGRRHRGAAAVAVVRHVGRSVRWRVLRRRLHRAGLHRSWTRLLDESTPRGTCGHGCCRGLAGSWGRPRRCCLSTILGEFRYAQPRLSLVAMADRKDRAAADGRHEGRESSRRRRDHSLRSFRRGPRSGHEEGHESARSLRHLHAAVGYGVSR